MHRELFEALYFSIRLLECFAGAFSDSLWSIITELTDRSSHPHANGDYDPWGRPDPRRDFILSLGFAAQRGNSKMLRDANTRRLANRAGGRYATGARA